MRPSPSLPLTAALGIGAACITYAAAYEVRSFRLRRVDVPVLADGAAPIRVLHISDLHFTPHQVKKREWIRNLALLEPDLVLNTGDTIAHRDAVPGVLEALRPLLDRPGAFVFGSNDYYAPALKNPARYLWQRRSRLRLEQARLLPWEDLQKGLVDAGWLDLSNTREMIDLDDGRQAELVGVDDPHIGRDRYEWVAGAARWPRPESTGPRAGQAGAPTGGGPAPAAESGISIGVTHAPYRRVLDRMADDGFPLIVAGHTHGGQVCVPLLGALVTNSDLDRRRVKGLSRYSSAWLHVSAGLGTSPYAPFRFACPPEATLLTLVATDFHRQ